jgi:hypothetical protein
VFLPAAEINKECVWGNGGILPKEEKPEGYYFYKQLLYRFFK